MVEDNKLLGESTDGQLIFRKVEQSVLQRPAFLVGQQGNRASMNLCLG